nr:hypothetical protein [uncultured Rhodopila sp.]
MRHRIFAVIAAAAAGIACLTAPALARGGGGGGGHGGAAGHGGFAARGAVFGAAARSGAWRAGGTAATAARGAAALGLYRAAITGRALTPIRPEVINVPAALGTGGINPSFTGAPIVPPFGAAPVVPPFGTAASYVALPVVTTPYAGVPVFAAADASRAAASQRTLPVGNTGLPGLGVPDATAVDPNTLHGTCHPVPHGYHCDWSS